MFTIYFIFLSVMSLSLLYASVSRYLGFVDKIGTAYQAPEVCTGFGQYFAIPMLRAAREKKADGVFTKEEARKVG